MRLSTAAAAKNGRPAMLIALGILLLTAGACGPRFYVEPVDGHVYPSSGRVEVIKSEPARPYRVIARFEGVERGVCEKAHPYCSLEAEARGLGAEAIWITEKKVYSRPDQWVEIEGRLTRIWGASYEWISGVLVRYE